VPIYTYQLRRDTALRWEEVNPVLALAEPGYEMNTGFMKIGDGVTPWNRLPYFVPTSEHDDGETPPSNGDSYAVHTQHVPSARWEIVHNLGKYPSVVVLDSARNMFEADVDYISANYLVIMFSGPMSGTATLN
jgi:hypothetical protein